MIMNTKKTYLVVRQYIYQAIIVHFMYLSTHTHHTYLKMKFEEKRNDCLK